jgi:hypothetical protein
MKAPASRTVPTHLMRPPNSDALSDGFKKYAGLLSGEHKKRVPLEGEAKPPPNDLWLRPVYNPARDNR